jgi:hypothetical protein
LTKPEESALLIAVSRPLAKFLEQLFQTDSTPVVARTQRDSEVARFKKEFVAKRVAKVTGVPEGDRSGGALELPRPRSSNRSSPPTTAGPWRAGKRA